MNSMYIIFYLSCETGNIGKNVTGFKTKRDLVLLIWNSEAPLILILWETELALNIT